jgi:hypothetical protein
MQQKLCRGWDIDEGLFRRKPSRDLIYERTTVFERGLSADFLAHDVIPSSMDTALLRRLNQQSFFWNHIKRLVSPIGRIQPQMDGRYGRAGTMAVL